MANVHFKNEFKVELEKKFKQEYQRQSDQIIATERTAASGTPEERERTVRNLLQKIQAFYPPDVFKSLQRSWLIRCDKCCGIHVHSLSADDVTAILRHSSVKKDTKNGLFYLDGFHRPIITLNPHIELIALDMIVRVYINSRLQEEQGKGG